jgi:hypothetical protein
MSRKGIPGKNRQNKEAGQNSTQLVVRGGQLRKLRWQRILILRLFLNSPPNDRGRSRSHLSGFSPRRAGPKTRSERINFQDCNADTVPGGGKGHTDTVKA